MYNNSDMNTFWGDGMNKHMHNIGIVTCALIMKQVAY